MKTQNDLKTKAKNLSVINRAKLLRYKFFLENDIKVNENEELKKLILYMANNDLSSELIKFLD